MNKTNRRNSKRRGSALLSAFFILMMMSVAAASYLSSATQSFRTSSRETLEVQTTPLCEAGVQTVLRNLWRPFKINQNFNNLDTVCTGATANNSLGSVSGTIPGAGNYAAGVIAYADPGGDPYSRTVTVRCVGWIDVNGNGQLDPGEPIKTVDVTSTFTLSRSQVFDYTYFVNNYGWMDGFGPNDLVVNGDMRANGDFSYTNGSPTVNGSAYASQNQKLVPPALGLVNEDPVKMSNSAYQSAFGNSSRVRQAYDPASKGAYGSTSYNNWRDFVFDTTGSVQGNHIAGAARGDARGVDSWARTSVGVSSADSVIDNTPTQEVVMPDLSNLPYYKTLSNNYSDTKATFADGTANPNFGKGATLQTWDPNANSGAGGYTTLSTNGVVTGSAAIVGSDAHPILIHGPVTFTQDALIKGTVSGQGTIYTGRNVHIVGSITYKTPPDFRGSNQTTIDNANEHADMLALAARGSVIMGDTSQFNDSYPLPYMTPPFTHARYDDQGNLIPAYNAKGVDGTGNMNYQSVMGDAYLHSIASPINQLDAILYTNFVGGGDIGTGGGGVTFNGSIISKDEAMVVFSLPMQMNYDSRIRERTVSQTPLIDLSLPRSPVMLRSTWQDRGFVIGS